MNEWCCIVQLSCVAAMNVEGDCVQQVGVRRMFKRDDGNTRLPSMHTPDETDNRYLDLGIDIHYLTPYAQSLFQRPDIIQAFFLVSK